MNWMDWAIASILIVASVLVVTAVFEKNLTKQIRFAVLGLLGWISACTLITLEVLRRR